MAGSRLTVDRLRTTDKQYEIAVQDLVLAGSTISVADLRTYTGSATRMFVYHAPLATSDPGGYFMLDTSITSPVDNTGLTIVDGSGRAWVRQFDGEVSVTWFGAKGDGVTDDTAAFNLAVATTSDAHTLAFPGGTYVLNSPDTVSGRVTWQGYNDAQLLGTITYSDTFPVSADNPTSTTVTSPFLTIRGLSFDSQSTTLYALDVTAQFGSSFIDCMEMSDCKFYGYLGFQATNLISVQLQNNWFYTVYRGMTIRGCTNWNIIGCFFRNCRQAGAYITYNPDNPGRLGGENMRFVNCEFAVCTKGIYAYRHVWLSVDNCLFDYNILPIELHGSYYAKIANSYLGAANQGSLTGNAGYVAPATLGCALYIHGAGADSAAGASGASYAGATCVNCEFVNYVTGSSIPIVYCEGYLDASNYYLLQNVTFIGNKFITAYTTNLTTMLSISYAANDVVQGNFFITEGLAPSMIAPYTASNCQNHNGVGNNNHNATISGTPVPMPYETQYSAGLTAVPGTGVWLRDTGGVQKLGVSTSGRPAMKNVTERTSAGTGGAAMPTTITGLVEVEINGTLRLIPHCSAT